VNLPASQKLAPPTYQGITADEIGSVALAAGNVRVVAGSFGGVTGPARTATPIALYDVTLEAGGEARFDFPEDHNLAILVMAGDVTAGSGEPARENELVVYGHGGRQVMLTAGRAARLLVMAGEPIREPIVQHGPFVMNTPEEIAQAIEDFNAGKFGKLV
jgi:redox-sensitive bicupin YhaK (pirin superfamily)